jgi:hypothetical protein
LEKGKEGVKELFIFVDYSFSLGVGGVRWDILMIVNFFNNFIYKV